MMQEKKNKQRGLVLVALLLATAGMFWLNNRGEAPTVSKDLFKTADLTTINEVVLRASTGATQLKFSGSQWRVNDQFDADRGMIDVLFATLRQAEPRRPVAVSQQDSIATTLVKEGVEVTLISGGEKIDVFYVGGNRQKTQAYFMRPGETPYIVTIPGYRVYTAGIFELAGQGWRSKYVFGFNWRNFSSLEAQHPGKETAGFRVELDDHQYFGIRGLALEKTDTAKLNNYLDAVSLLQVQEYQTPSPALDSLGKMAPLFFIEVKDVGGTAYTLELFPFRPSSSTEASARAVPLMGRIDRRDWAVFRESDLLSLIQPKAFFSKE